MTTLTMTKGLPGSGKSHRAKAQVKMAQPGTLVRVNKDDIRTMLHDGKWSSKNEKRVLQARDSMVITFLSTSVSVIVDDTNFHPSHENRLRELALWYGAEFKIDDFTDVPLHICIRQDLQRSASVGAAVIRKMHDQYLRPVPVPPAVIQGADKAIIVDIDGTLARMTDRGPFEWSKVGSDEPIKDVVSLVRTLYWGSAAQLIFMSGRDAVCYDETRAWLRKHVGEWTQDCALHMRAEGDNRKDTIVKEEKYQQYIYGKYNVRFVLDDRDSVVEMWRGLGLTCFQAAPGNF
jgi:predicted kinase